MYYGVLYGCMCVRFWCAIAALPPGYNSISLFWRIYIEYVLYYEEAIQDKGVFR